MIEGNDLLGRLQQLLKHKQSKAYYAKKLGISEEYVDKLLKELKNQDSEEELDNQIKEVNNEKGTVKSTVEVSFEPKSDIELAALHKIDLSKYKISTYWSKLKTNGKFSSSVLASLKKPEDYTAADFAKFLENWTPHRVIPKFYNWNLTKEAVDVELNIADFHLAKKTKQGDDLSTKVSDYLITINDLIGKIINNYNINKLVFPISNDFFHSDNYQNTTTNGTPQDVTAWYDQEYEVGFNLLVSAITYLSTKAKEIEVILVQGNHDRTKGFYVAHALEVFFKEYKQVKFQRHHSVTKSTVLGNTFIGYHHGNNCKLEDLPLLFATGKDSEAFGKARYREVHTGDKHHYLAKEVKGVRIQQMPSLSGTDRWHQDNGFVNQVRAALALVYHPEQGKICEFEHRI
jgi:hypothetical protein